jgi:hypothetical protein
MDFQVLFIAHQGLQHLCSCNGHDENIYYFKLLNGKLAAVLRGVWPLLSTADLLKSPAALKLAYLLAKAARAK